MTLNVKKILLALIATITLLTLCGCKSPTFYYGVVVEDEGVMFVKMSNVEKAILPVAEGAENGAAVKIKAGDVIKMEFDGNCYFYDTKPKTFGVEPKITVIMRNVYVSYDENGYFLTFPNSLAEGSPVKDGKIDITSGSETLVSVDVTSATATDFTVFCEIKKITVLLKALENCTLKAA